MPDGLFYNSKVNVVSCIMIFTAHRPHPQYKQTYFGYYKDDGFVINRIEGRSGTRKMHRWDKIKQKWLANFLNKEDEPGLSVNKTVTAKDEWCAEAYMQTNDNWLTKNHFKNTLKHYSSFLFSNEFLDIASKESINQQNVKLDKTEWKWFKLDKYLFEITGCQKTSILELEDYKGCKSNGQYPYVTARTVDNGTYKFYDFYTEKMKVMF
uniref:Uncharacterized protein n=1 Tax=Halimeda micronesica TaxID=170426 RepID=A0A386AXI0_9CHLO|nr:hypothetical protein [Halimeda micronesica]